jgi:hypothetical protein
MRLPEHAQDSAVDHSRQCLCLLPMEIEITLLTFLSRGRLAEKGQTYEDSHRISDFGLNRTPCSSIHNRVLS